jgi:hypothetical protein
VVGDPVRESEMFPPRDVSPDSFRDPRAWAMQMQRALDWDSKHPTSATSQRANATKWRETRAGLQKVRAYVLANAATINAGQGAAQLPPP